MENGMLVLDTNAWYYYKEKSQNNKINLAALKQKINSEQTYITTASIVEMIIHFKDNSQIIEEMLEDIVIGKFQIIKIGHLPISSDIISELYDKIRQKSDITSIVNDLIQKRVETETTFMHIFLCTSFHCFIYLLYKEYYKLDEQDIYRKTQALIFSNEEFIKETFAAKLRDGYKNDKVKEKMCDIYDEMFKSMIETWIGSVANNLDYNGDLNEFIESIKSDEVYIALKNASNKNNNVFFVIKKMRNKISNYNKVLNNYIDETVITYTNDVVLKDNFTYEISEYYKDMLTKVFLKDEKVRKNDVIDMLLLYIFKLDNSARLLAFDKKLQKVIKEISINNFDEINSCYL